MSGASVNALSAALDALAERLEAPGGLDRVRRATPDEVKSMAIDRVVEASEAIGRDDDPERRAVHALSAFDNVTGHVLGSSLRDARQRALNGLAPTPRSSGAER